MYVYGAWGMWEVCCVAAVVNDSVFCLGVLKYVVSCRCCMLCHADVVCLCLVCILWQFSMLNSA